MRIIYAAANRIGSYYQLIRFLQSVKHQNHNIKIAAYKNSIKDIDIDYTLDSLLNFSNPTQSISYNGNYNYYLNEIKRFSPDLIISDLEIYSSIIALELNIRLWQYSPILIYYALKNEIAYAIGVHKSYSYLINGSKNMAATIQYILRNSDKRLVLSHICDSTYADIITNNYEWIRPNFLIGEGKEKTQRLAIFTKFQPNIFNKFSNKGTVIFSKSPYLDIDNEHLYKKYLERCSVIIGDGTSTFLADAFYNQKYYSSYPRYDDIECIIGSFINKYCQCGTIGNLDSNNRLPIQIQINNKVKFISNLLESQ
jgi:hypothetical protein